MVFYINPHRSQYDPDSSPVTRKEGCGPTSGANGANASTGGKVSKTGEQVHDLIPKSEETDPSSPGWSIADIDHAMQKLGVGFESRVGDGWAAVVAAWSEGKYVALQGDSDRFSNNTCSGDFDGDHCVGVHPMFRVVSGRRQRWTNDPICPSGRWEYESILHDYAVKFRADIGFGVFTAPVPQAAVPKPPPAVVLYPGATKLTPRLIKKIAVPRGRVANGRPKPKKVIGQKPIQTLANGKTFTAYQVTKKGQNLAGSSTWYGDRLGKLWYHSSSF